METAAPDPATSPPLPQTGVAAASAVKKPAWNIPAGLNGPIETGPPVIDESSWPALSEAAKSPMKPSDGSSAITPTISSSPSKPHFPNPTSPSLPNPNPSSSSLSNPNSPSRSSSKRSLNLLPSNPISSNPNPISPNSSDDQTAPARAHSHRPRGGYNGNNTNTIRPRGGPSNNNNNRGGNNSNNNGNNGRGQGGQYRNLNGPGYVVPPVYVRPGNVQPVLAGNVQPFIAAPTPVRPPPFGPPPMVYQDMPPSPVYYVPAPGPVPPFVPGGGPVFLPPIDPTRAALLKQIDYYFSSDNLCKDTWLRSQMDDQGFVPISLIANFNKVKQITINIPFILDTLHMSYIVEVQGDKIRKRGDWMNWLIRPTNTDNLTTRIQNVNLEGEKNESDKSPSEITLDTSSTQEGGEKKVDDQN